MVREYSVRTSVRSYEVDAWGYVPTAVVMRYLEQTSVEAASAGGYGSDFHRRQGTAWIVRRMTLLMHEPIRQECDLVATTWLSSISKVRAFREYKVREAASGELFYTALTEWVYMNRESYTPLPVPPHLIEDYDVPGHNLQQYEPSDVPQESGDSFQSVVETKAEWHEADSMGHVNNTVYADWLDDAVYEAVASAGHDLAALRLEGVSLRGRYYNLSYKRSAIPGDRIRITTTCLNSEGPLFAFEQSITGEDDAELLTASSIYEMHRR